MYFWNSNPSFLILDFGQLWNINRALQFSGKKKKKVNIFSKSLNTFRREGHLTTFQLVLQTVSNELEKSDKNTSNIRG